MNQSAFNAKASESLPLAVLIKSKLGFDKFLDPFAPTQAQPERAALLLRYQFKSEERTAKTLARDKLRGQKNRGLLSLKAESIAVRQWLYLFDCCAHLLRHRFMTFSPFGVQRRHTAGEGRFLRRFFLFDFVLCG